MHVYEKADVWKDFTNILPFETGIEQVDAFNNAPQKIFRDGQVVILRGEQTYSVTGQEQ